MSVEYSRINFVNRNVETPHAYEMVSEGNGIVTLTPHPGVVEDEGTPLNETNMNKLDKGVYDCAEAINAMVTALSSALRFVKTLKSTDSLDDVYTPGTYIWLTTSLPTGSPTNSYARMLVIGSTDETIAGKEQIIFTHNNRIMIRTGANGAWGSWTTFYPLALDRTLTVSGAAADALAVKEALDDKQGSLTFDEAPTEMSQNPVTSGGVHAALSGKQGTLTFDSEPRSGSQNPVTSGGVKAALDAQKTASDTAIENKVKTFTATIPTTGWTSNNNGEYYTKVITVSGILASDTPDIGIVQTGTFATDEAIRDAWSRVTRITASAKNKLTITACDVLPTAIPIQVRCIR